MGAHQSRKRRMGIVPEPADRPANCGCPPECVLLRESYELLRQLQNDSEQTIQCNLAAENLADKIDDARVMCICGTVRL